MRIGSTKHRVYSSIGWSYAHRMERHLRKLGPVAPYSLKQKPAQALKLEQRLDYPTQVILTFESSVQIFIPKSGDEKRIRVWNGVLEEESGPKRSVIYYWFQAADGENLPKVYGAMTPTDKVIENINKRYLWLVRRELQYLGYRGHDRWSFKMAR